MELKPLTRDHKYDAVAAYVFAGGMSVGMGQHFNVVAHLEEGPYGAKTVHRNLPNIPIHDTVFNWPLDVLTGVHLLYANPPCAVWSPLGKSAQNKSDWRGDERLHCWDNVINAGITVGADIVSVESVPQVITRGMEFVLEKARQVTKAGYAVTVIKHDGRFLGLPQIRRRVMFVAHKVALSMQLPSGELTLPRDALAGLTDPGHVDPTPAAWVPAINLVDPKSKDRKTIRESILHHYTPEEFKTLRIRKPSFLDGRISLDRPTGTIVRGSLYHWTEPRHLGLNEYKRLCGYPDWFEWELEEDKVWPTGRAVQEMVRAVMPPVAEWFGAMYERSLDAHDPVECGSLTMINVGTASGRATDNVPVFAWSEVAL